MSWSLLRVGEGWVSLIEVLKVFPPKKNLTLFVPYTCTPNHQKKVLVEKKLNEPLPPPFDSKSQCVALVLPLDLYWGLPPQLLGPSMSDLSLLHLKMIIMIFCWLNLSLVSPGIFVNSQNIVFVSTFGQLCRVVVSYKYQSGLCVCYRIPSWSAVISSVINRY